MKGCRELARIIRLTRFTTLSSVLTINFALNRTGEESLHTAVKRAHSEAVITSFRLPEQIEKVTIVPPHTDPEFTCQGPDSSKKQDDMAEKLAILPSLERQTLYEKGMENQANHVYEDDHCSSKHIAVAELKENFIEVSESAYQSTPGRVSSLPQRQTGLY